RLKADASGGKPETHSPIPADVPATARSEFEKADGLLAKAKKENMEEAARHLEKALGLYPKFLQAELKLGTIYMDLAQWDKAEQTLRKAIEMDPKAANAFFA